LSATAGVVAGLFFPQSKALGLEPDYDLSPAVWRKVVYAGTQAASFEQAARDLAQLAELDISDQRVRRATIKIGTERCQERDAQTAAFAALPLPQQRVSPVEQTPQAVCVEMDGGRMQIRERGAEAPASTSEGFWREMKVGCLTTLTREVHTEDPCPQLPAAFADREKMAKIAREIKGFASAAAPAEEAAPEEAAEPAVDDRAGRPQPLARSVVATRRGVEEFGPLLAAAAWNRGFAAARAKAFVADGAEANWGVGACGGGGSPTTSRSSISSTRCATSMPPRWPDDHRTRAGHGTANGPSGSGAARCRW
jgi:hypothetical protein